MMINLLKETDRERWDAYVHSHPNAALYHLSGLKNVIEQTYGHKTYYLMAERDDGQVAGILPLVHIKHFLFGNNLFSIPFFDMGGVLADDRRTEEALLVEAGRLGQNLHAQSIELRHNRPLLLLASNGGSRPARIELIDMSLFSEALGGMSCLTRSHKVRMLLELPDSSEALMASFKSKLRSQIKKPIKEGLTSRIGGVELLDDFYKVFSINMRDLGSPVHSKKLLANVMAEYKDAAKIAMVYQGDQPLAGSVVVGFKETLENPWASSLREYSRLSPNMLLYWIMLEYACENNFRFFDFGRSSPDEGTYKFKAQWGAQPQPLHWHCFSLNGHSLNGGPDDKSKFDKAIQYWQKLPVSISKIIGPMIRQHIGL